MSRDDLRQIIEDSDTVREALSAISYAVFPSAEHDWLAAQLESMRRCEETLRILREGGMSDEGWEQLVHGLREECQELSDRLDALEAERDRYREALQQADEELTLIADDASEHIGTRIDSLRALLKDAL